MNASDEESGSESDGLFAFDHTKTSFSSRKHTYTGQSLQVEDDQLNDQDNSNVSCAIGSAIHSKTMGVADVEQLSMKHNTHLATALQIKS